jgi:kinesin family protein 4/21/27
MATENDVIWYRSQSQSQSLSQELYSARSRMQSLPNVNGHASRSPSSPRPNLSISLPIGPGQERSVASLEKEIMRLQEVLKEREAEIMTLETTLKAKDVEKRQSARSEHSRLTNGNAHSDDEDFSPQIKKHIAAIRQSMEFRHPPEGVSPEEEEEDEPLDRLNELML